MYGAIVCVSKFRNSSLVLQQDILQPNVIWPATSGQSTQYQARYTARPLHVALSLSHLRAKQWQITGGKEARRKSHAS